MRDLLSFYGHDFTEDMVFGLGSGIDFMYVRLPALEPPVYIGGRVPELERNICERLGVGMEVVSGLDAEEGWLAVKAMIDEGTPVMVHADVYHLDYLKARRHFSAHRIVLVGYDDERGVAFVADNDRDSIQECSLENLALARSASYFPRPADQAYYRLDVPKRLVPLEEAVPGALAEAARHNALLGDGATFTMDGADVALGVAGIAAFASEMPAWPTTMSPEMLSLTCKTIYVSAEKGGTGYGGNFRRMYGRFLTEASSLDGFGALAEVGREFIATGDLWTELSLIFKDLSSDGEAAVERAHPIATQISARETAAFAALNDITMELSHS